MGQWRGGSAGPRPREGESERKKQKNFEFLKKSEKNKEKKFGSSRTKNQIQCVFSMCNSILVFLVKINHKFYIMLNTIKV